MVFVSQYCSVLIAHLLLCSFQTLYISYFILFSRRHGAVISIGQVALGLRDQGQRLDGSEGECIVYRAIVVDGVPLITEQDTVSVSFSITFSLSHPFPLFR